MKKNLFMVAAVALIATVSCNKELENNSVQGPASDVVFVAELEQPNADATEAPAAVQTKTSLGSTANGVTAVNWVKDDKIKVNGIEFKAASAGSKTNFTPTASFNSASTYNAVYPATAAGASDLSKVTIPASQTGTFAEAAISVAKSSTQSLSFKNVASILKFQVPSDCSTITIESTYDLAGTFPVTFSNDLPVIGAVSSGSKKITLTGSFKTDNDYYVAVLPGSHKFTVRLNGYLSKASTTAVTTKRAVITNLQTLPALVESKWKIMGQPSWDYSDAVVMYKEYNMAVAKNLKISGGFKFNDGTDWMAAGAVSAKKLYVHIGNGSDMTIAAGTYDVYIANNTDMHNGCSRGFFFIVPAGTDLSTLSANNSLTNKYGIIGNNGNWDNDTFMTFDYRGYFVAKGIKMSGSEFKIRANAGWTDSWGTGGNITSSGQDIYHNGANSKVNAGTYDIYTDFNKIWAMSEGSAPAL